MSETCRISCEMQDPPPMDRRNTSFTYTLVVSVKDSDLLFRRPMTTEKDNGRERERERERARDLMKREIAGQGVNGGSAGA
jgi:hypothetical protein